MKKYTVTVAICAYNEEGNIANILYSLLRQKQKTINVKEILVYSDGSTDKTHDKVRSLHKKNPRIKLIIGKERKGKYFRVNQIFRNCKKEILVVLDADIGLVGDHFLEKLVKPLLSDPKAQMVAAHNTLLRPHNFIGKVIHANFVLWDFVRLGIPNYDNAANFYGSATAYRGSFAQSVTIPNTLSDPHLYIYLMAKKNNGFRYCQQAEVLQWPITTLTDYNKFLNRTIGKRDKKLEKLFGVKTEAVYYFPLRNKLIGVMKAFISQPFYTLLGILLTIYKGKINPPKNTNTSPIWEILKSSKKPIHEK